MMYILYYYSDLLIDGKITCNVLEKVSLLDSYDSLYKTLDIFFLVIKSSSRSEYVNEHLNNFLKNLKSNLNESDCVETSNAFSPKIRICKLIKHDMMILNNQLLLEHAIIDILKEHETDYIHYTNPVVGLNSSQFLDSDFHDDLLFGLKDGWIIKKAALELIEIYEKLSKEYILQGHQYIVDNEVVIIDYVCKYDENYLYLYNKNDQNMLTEYSNIDNISHERK